MIINKPEEGQFPELRYHFAVKYLKDGHTYEVSNLKQGLQHTRTDKVTAFTFKKDGQNSDRQEMQLPLTVIASSMTIADKFPTPSAGIYKYRGIRSEKTPSTTGTRTIVRKAVEDIMDSLAHKHTTREEIATILSELGFRRTGDRSVSRNSISTVYRSSIHPMENVCPIAATTMRMLLCPTIFITFSMPRTRQSETLSSA